MTIYSAQDQVSNQRYIDINGMLISNNATTPNTKIDVSAGLCGDVSNSFDINLGNWYGSVPVPANANVVSTIDATLNGALGLDQGSLAASKVYYVHVIFDISGQLLPSVMISLSKSAPLLPAGYSNFRWIGQMMTDSSSHFLLGYNSGQNRERVWVYDAPQATSVTAGTSATYAPIDLSALVPNGIAQLPVLFRVNWTANAAGDTFNMQGVNATGDQWTLIAPAAGGTAHTVGFGIVNAQISSSLPKVNYKVSAVGGVAINVAGFSYSL